MRCAECGQDLSQIASGAPCTECGTVTPDDRRTLPPLRMGRVVAGFAWPYVVMLLLFGSAVLVTRVLNGEFTYLIPALLLVALVVLVLIVPINAARRTTVLMRRRPRREYMAPLLALTPRIVLVPLLAAGAAFLLGVALAFGSCMVGAEFAKS